MKRYVRTNIRQLEGYIPGEQPGEKRYIKLNTNENPYPPSPRVRDSITTEMDSNLKIYPDPECRKLLRAASRVYQISESNILAGNGSDELLAILSRVFLGEKDRAVFPSPTYTLYDTLVKIQGGVPEEVPFPDDFSLPKGIQKKRGKLIFLANPNSPSGTFTKIETLRAVADSFRGIVVIDEAYADFAEKSAIQLVKDKENVVVLRTFSKSFSLAGIRLGLAFAPEWIIEEMRKVKDSYNVNSLTLAAGTAALGHTSWMKKNVRKVVATRTHLVSSLVSLGFEVFPSEANFVLARIKGKSLKSLYLDLKKRRILVRYFDIPRLFDSVRISVGTGEETGSLLRIMGEILKKG